MRATLDLEPWTARRNEVLALEVKASQKAFIDSSVAEFLADADEHPGFSSYAVCDGDTVVGFACFGYEARHERGWWIPLIVIDRRFQGNGYGRGTMEAVIARIREEAPDNLSVGLNCRPDNHVALDLYRSLGFEATGTSSRGDVEMWLPLSAQ